MKLLIYLLIWTPLTFGLFIFSALQLAAHVNQNPKDILGSVSLNITSSIKFIPTSTPVPIVLHPEEDVRNSALRKFFSDYKSPLVKEVEILVKQADLWGLDYALIPAIAMQESQGCKTIPLDSYNCWGFGIYGSKITRFKNYEEAVSQVAKTIKETYIKKGLTNPTLLEDRWAPSSRGLWSYSVNFFIGKIREIEKNISST